MESSEDDAGTATSASRRASAREKDVGQAEDVDATSSYHQDINEGRTSCQTPAMSEDNFDGDSVPSPSAQDVNTSTEAILDMIDEIVDGPGAPKRLPLPNFDSTREFLISATNTTSSEDSVKLDVEPDPPPAQLTLSEHSAKSDILDENTSNVQVEYSSLCEPAAREDIAVSVESIPQAVSVEDAVIPVSVESVPIAVSVADVDIPVSIEPIPQAVSVPDCKETVLSVIPEPTSAVLVEPETSVACPGLPSSSVSQNDSEVSECNKTERTFKSVSSSDNRDNITIEKAESTSSDCIVSETIPPLEVSVVKSPLKRRLIRPPPLCDRRPDSTVSSTVDSQTTDIFSNVQSSETITKDVSSSSDAMPIEHGNDKTEEIRDISDVSICKAEASVSPPKKIKLIRQKIIPPTPTEKSSSSDQQQSSVKEQCQSTSIDVNVRPAADLHEESSSTIISTSKEPELCESSGPDTIASDLPLEAPLLLCPLEQHTQQDILDTETCRPSSPNRTIETEQASSQLNDNIELPIESNVCDSKLQENVVSNVNDEKLEESPKEMQSICEDDQKASTITEENLSISDPVVPEVDKAEISESVNIVSETNIDISMNVDDSMKENCLTSEMTVNQEEENLSDNQFQEDNKKVPPIKLTLTSLPEASTSQVSKDEEKSSIIKNESDSTKQIPKLTIRLNNKQTEEIKSPIPKLTIKPIRPPSEEEGKLKDQEAAPVTKLNIKPISRPTSEVTQMLSSTEEENISKVELFPNVTKINIKPILKPPDSVNDTPVRLHSDVERGSKENTIESLPCITKLNIKPILKPPEKINDIHRKSSSSEISESECSENDETSTSDQASTSDQGPSDIVPKVTIKLGKPGTISEGKFYTEQNIPKLTIKGLQNNECDDEESTSKLKLIINEPEDTQSEKIPKMTIKTVSKSEGQPLSPKLTIKPLKPPDNITRESETAKSKSHDFLPGSPEVKESMHIPKITIKPITRSEADTASKTPKKSITSSDNAEHIPIVTKLNIKPILKPTESEDIDNVEDKVPVVSKLNIKPVVKPKDNELESSIEDVPKITKLNIKPLRNPEVNSSEPKDCDADTDENSIPVVTKINIKPIVKPIEEDVSKDSENQSSETGNSSDDNADIPIVTKLNIKPIVKPVDSEETSKSSISNEHTIPAITKLNIKPLVKPDDSGSAPSSPKKEHLKNLEYRSSPIPIVTKLNIKPVLKPEEKDQVKSKEEIEEKTPKNPPLVMKINRKAMVENADNEVQSHNEHVVCNNLNEYVNDVNETTSDLKGSKQFEVDNSLKVSSGDIHQSREDYKFNSLHDRNDSENIDNTFPESSVQSTHNCVSENITTHYGDRATSMKKTVTTNVSTTSDTKGELSGSQINSSLHETTRLDTSFGSSHSPCVSETGSEVTQVETSEIRGSPKSEMPLNKTPYVQNCKLLKKLLENSRDQLVKRVEDSRNTNCMPFSDKKDPKMVFHKDMVNCSTSLGSPHDLQVVDYNVRNINTDASFESDKAKSSGADKIIDTNHSTLSYDLTNETNDSLTKPLEINISEKYSGQSSGQDSPRIILKINKTDHGASAKIITEDIKRSENFQQKYTENTLENLSGRESPRKHIGNSRRKMDSEEPVTLAVGKRLRSSRIVDSSDKSPPIKRNVGKRPSTTEVSPVQSKETELTVLETKRLKLGQLLSGNKSLTQPVVRATQISPTKTGLDNKQVGKVTNHSILNNENCSKNGNSKLHNILSNLQAKQKQSIAMKETTIIDKSQCVGPELGSDVKTSLSVDIGPIENCHVQVQEMMINENCDLRDHGPASDASEALQDPLEVAVSKVPSAVISDSIIPPRIEQLTTPQPKKRGRPRKLPVSEGAKPAIVTLPIPALEERPQRSLRLTRERPTILTKPRGRGRGRGRRAEISTPSQPETVTVPMDEADDRILRPIDPTSSRIKLPRMTEALDKMPGGCSTPLSSRRRSSGAFSEVELKVVLEATVPKLEEAFAKSPEIIGRGRGGRGSRGGRGRTPRGRGRGRGGGRGAVYMKETMGIYGRVCGPATTTVQLFEEETCMMDDNATPAKSSHLLDEDSQSSVKSSTNESSKMKKSKFSDLFDSNKVWTAADVKEYTWPTQETADALPQVMMIQEQVAMFLGVKSFKRRYPELKRRAIVGEEKDYVLAKGLVTEALCDLGITAVDASEVLDIMLSDYPHKYEEYRSHQRERQLTEPSVEPPVEIKQEEKVVKVEIKMEKPAEQKPELPKIDPEKTRQDMAAAAIASASEWNARANAWRRPACVDLQSLSVHRRRAPPARAPTHLRPPAGFYPHALLPGQYQHCYRVYTPDQLRYFPLNTALVAPPAPPSPAESSSDSEPEWGSRSSSSDDSDSHTHPAKRKKLSKMKRSSQAESKEKEKEKEEVEVSVEDTCRACKLRLEGNRKYTHERFLVCASCNAKLHPSCVELSADTIRKCREYPWQCAECKTCCACRLPADDDKMLFCDLCDRGFHIYCVGLDAVPNGRWHCVECAVCKSCGAREPGGLAPESGASPAPPAAGAAPAWHHQTRRGPGGHKVYSHSLCTPCARAYRIGRYCPLCERSFIGPKGTMQLVICKLCDRQLHQECVRQTVSSLNVLDYTCAECRRGGITSRAAAARLAPRTIATLFMAKRRFNKYAHRQYMRSRMLEAEAAAAERAPSPPSPRSPRPAPHAEPADGSDASDGAEPADPADDPLQGAG